MVLGHNVENELKQFIKIEQKIKKEDINKKDGINHFSVDVNIYNYSNKTIAQLFIIANSKLNSGHGNGSVSVPCDIVETNYAQIDENIITLCRDINNNNYNGGGLVGGILNGVGGILNGVVSLLTGPQQQSQSQQNKNNKNETKHPIAIWNNGGCYNFNYQCSGGDKIANLDILNVFV